MVIPYDIADSDVSGATRKGPAYVERHGVISGIVVRSAQDGPTTGRRQRVYGVLEYYTRVSRFSKWIEDVVRRR